MDAQTRLMTDGYDPKIVKPVLFYSSRKPWGMFSNFATAFPIRMRHPFTGEEVIYATTEHRYQAMKATTMQEHEHVRTAQGPGEAAKRGRSEIALRPDWTSHKGGLSYYIMMESVFAKVARHSAVKSLLKRSEGRPIYEDSPTDDIWGWRYKEDHRGKNLLGEVLMDIRAYARYM